MRKTVFIGSLLALLAGAGVACAQQAEAGPGKTLAKAINMATDPPTPKDFVVRSRPPEDRLDYIPIGGARAERARKPMDPQTVKAREAALTALAERQKARLASRPGAQPKLRLPAYALKAKAEHDAMVRARSRAGAN